jgi:hypothetical protein
MLDLITKDKAFISLMHKQAYETVALLISKQHEFGVVCHVENIIFTPDISQNIKDSFSTTSFFVVSGYSLEHAHLKDNNLIFEAGFGEENIGSKLHIPIYDIVQIIIEDIIVFINPSVGIKIQEKTKLIPPTKDELKNSMEALLKNINRDR